jgi:hypothetical protein
LETYWNIHDLLVLSREWMGMGVAGMIITSDYGSFPHSLLSTGKIKIPRNVKNNSWLVDTVMALYQL